LSVNVMKASKSENLRLKVKELQRLMSTVTVTLYSWTSFYIIC
jgi:hypothetical protein